MAVRQPPYLLRLRVQNYRSLRDVEVRLAPLNVLVGPNGAGKSNLLDVIAFLGDATREDLAPALERRGRFDRVCFRGSPSGEAIVVEVETVTGGEDDLRTTDTYTLSVGRGAGVNRDGKYMLTRWETFDFGPGAGITVQGNRVTYRDAQGERDIGSIRQGLLGLTTLPKVGDVEAAEQVEALGNVFAAFRVFDVDVAAARQPSIGQFSAELADDASNLAPFLAYLQAEHPERFAALERDARSFVPGLERLTFTPIGGASEGTVLSLDERDLPGATTLREASYGSVRALALLALLYDPAPPPLTCIEEIDHGLHPHILDRLVELLREASQRTQFLIATHSPALVNRLTADELIVCEKGDDGASRIPAIEPAKVRAMERELHGEIGLGELWFSGALGGVPA